jgi:SSS family solute:Na+ symporter
LTSVVLLIVAYTLAVFIFGTFVGRRKAQDFLLASRSVGLWQTTASILAVAGGVTLLTTVALAYEKGLGAMWLWVGTSLGLVALATFAKRIKTASDRGFFLTIADFIAERTGRANGILCAILLGIVMFGSIAGEYVAAGTLFSSFIGINYTPSVFIVCAGGLCYLLMAGYRAVVRTDVFQFTIMLVVLGGVLFTIDLGQYKPEQLNFVSLGGVSILTLMVLAGASTATAAEFWERIYAARSIATARRALYLAAFVFIIFGMGLVILGMAAKAHHPGLDPNRALYYGLFELTPPRLRGFCIVMILAAVQSTIDTELFYMATSYCNDLFAGDKKLPPEKLRSKIRIALVVLGVSGALIAVLVRDILTLVFTVAGLLTAISPVVLGLLFFPIKKQAAFVSMLGGALSLVVIMVIGKFDGDTASITFPVALVLLILGQIVCRK